MKKLVLGTAISALMLSTAFAQAPNTGTNGSTASPPAATSTPAPAASSAAPAASGSMNFVSSQKPEQMLASKFKGTDVVGTDNAKIGDVSDILFDKDGKIEAFVISVGGFLGVGSKSVAIAPSAFEVVKGTNNESDKLKLAATKDQLKEAQNFEPYNPPRTTTGSAGGMGGAGMGARPSSNTPPASSR
ncbi:MAG: PRC-barrel domain-containing protein [Rhizobiales bacterium]|nr:PRC-barrel domain-containing protein [Hyphomicrobiales bacterium]